MDRPLRPEFGGGTHARSRSAAANGQLRRFGACLHDIRHRCHHECQHAPVHLLIFFRSKFIFSNAKLREKNPSQSSLSGSPFRSSHFTVE